MLKLRDVTICNIDCVTPRLAALAIERSMRHVAFGRALLLCNTDVPLPAGVERIATPPIDSRESYSRFLLEVLPAHIETDHVLVVQWDGFVTSPACWDPRFLEYDYVGAPWPDINEPYQVGNGGFSLRSRRLLRACRELPPCTHLEDAFICVEHRARLEQAHGIRFAPTDLARRFSSEDEADPTPSFGFHSIRKMPTVLDDKCLCEVLAGMSPASTASQHGVLTMLQLLMHARFMPARVIYQRWRLFDTDTRIHDCLTALCGNDSEAARQIMQPLS